MNELPINRIEQIKALLSEDPNDSFLRFALAKEYEKANLPQQAIDEYIDLKNRDPKYIGLYYHLGKMYELINQNDMAIAIYQEGIEIAKGLSDFHALSELHQAHTNLTID